MLRKFFIVCFIFPVFSECSHAQLIDPTSSFRTVPGSSYFRFHYDNDFFTKSDEYYSQGISLEYVHPLLKSNPINRILIKPKNGNNKYGITFNLFGYTPTSILSDSILYGDRPFAAAITLGSFVTGADTINRIRVSSAFYIGVIGQAGLGYEIQEGIHRWLKNPLPHGWEHQVRNDIILNYQLNYEKALLYHADHFLLNGVGEIRAGTLNNKLAAGINFMAGNFSDRFKSMRSKLIEYYFYGQVRGNIIAYDASLQGGLLNRKSPYTISSADISRATLQADAGIIVNFRRLYLSYTQSFLTREFKSGKNHRWGGISVGFSL